MVTLLKILVLYLISASKCAYIVSEPTTLFNYEEKVKQKMDDFNKILVKITDNEIRFRLEGKIEEVVQKAVESDLLLINQGRVEQQKELAEEWAWFELMRQQIEYFEENNFPQPYDDDFESKKILWNKERLKGKSNFELHEERRYQKFKYYLEHPPNEAVQKLRNRLDIANISVEVFSRGVAKAYRLISARIHDGYIKWLHKNLDDFFVQKDVLIAMEILLDEMGISRKLIKKIENAASRTKNGLN